MKKTGYIKLIKSFIILTVLAGLLTSCVSSNGRYVKAFNDGKKYATNYMPEKDSGSRVGIWDVRKAEAKEKAVVEIYNFRHDERKEPREYLSYEVFDTPADAAEEFDRDYEVCKKENSHYWDEGLNWFVSQEPGVCDAIVIWMKYIEGNVIITAELDSWSTWSDDYTGEPRETRFDTKTLKEYVIENAPELRRYVLKDILGY